MDTNILLESGTNELEVLEFIIEGKHYGINVAKVREILPIQEITPIPNSHPCIEGIFMPRDTIITVVNLIRTLGYDAEPRDDNMLIVTNFNNLNIAFIVNRVIGIHRVSWTDIVKPDSTVNTPGSAVATGIIKHMDNLVIVLDFEKIVEDICPETGLRISDIDNLGERERNNIPVLVAEDSPLLTTLIHDSLMKAGYSNITMTANGQEAWDKLCALKRTNGVDYGCKILITDIEMPMMDGHRLIKLIREDNALQHIPIVIFSSLINDDMRRKGEQLGADRQISKPEIGSLVSILDELVKEQL